MIRLKFKIYLLHTDMNNKKTIFFCMSESLKIIPAKKHVFTSLQRILFSLTLLEFFFEACLYCVQTTKQLTSDCSWYSKRLYNYTNCQQISAQVFIVFFRCYNLTNRIQKPWYLNFCGRLFDSKKNKDKSKIKLFLCTLEWKID